MIRPLENKRTSLGLGRSVCAGFSFYGRVYPENEHRVRSGASVSPREKRRLEEQLVLADL